MRGEIIQGPMGGKMVDIYGGEHEGLDYARKSREAVDDEGRPLGYRIYKPRLWQDDYTDLLTRGYAANTPPF